MKKLIHLKGASVLNSVALKSINGGAGPSCGCAGRPYGSKCYGGPNCHCIGQCGSGNECNLW